MTWVGEKGKQDWQTPEWFLDLVRQVGPIRLDPCTSVSNPTKAQVFYTGGGLLKPWNLGGLTFANYPFGDARRWTDKAIRTVNESPNAELILLGAAQVGTKWFHDMAWHAAETLLWRGRIDFVDPNTGLEVPGVSFSCFVAYWGLQAERFCQVFGKYGMLIQPK